MIRRFSWKTTANRGTICRASPLSSQRETQSIGATIVLADVSELRRLDEMKNGLLSLVSHELKTPLTSMRMVLHLVADQRVGPLNPKQKELMDAARGRC